MMKQYTNDEIFVLNIVLDYHNNFDCGFFLMLEFDLIVQVFIFDDNSYWLKIFFI